MRADLPHPRPGFRRFHESSKPGAAPDRRLPCLSSPGISEHQTRCNLSEESASRDLTLYQIYLAAEKGVRRIYGCLGGRHDFS